MHEIRVEHNPSEDQLSSLGVAGWPIWEKEQSTFPWSYDRPETRFFLAGDVVVTPDGGDPVSMGKDDLVTFPAGMSCTWEIRQGCAQALHIRLGRLSQIFARGHAMRKPAGFCRITSTLAAILLVTACSSQAGDPVAEQNLQQGKAFLEQNKSKKGVETLPSGLQYMVLKKGDGSRPRVLDSVTVHYRAMHVDGTEFNKFIYDGRACHDSRQGHDSRLEAGHADDERGCQMAPVYPALPCLYQP